MTFEMLEVRVIGQYLAGTEWLPLLRIGHTVTCWGIYLMREIEEFGEDRSQLRDILFKEKEHERKDATKKRQLAGFSLLL